MSTVFIHAHRNTPYEDLDDDDRDVAGVYEVALDPYAPADGLANAALDGFHARLPVSVLDDFTFVVREGADPNSLEISCSDGHDGYQLAGMVRSVELLSPEFRVLAEFVPEAWVRDQAVVIDGATEIDVTMEVLRLASDDLSALHAVRDARDTSDDLARSHLERIEHSGPFTVRVVQSILRAFGVDSLEAITADMVSKAAATLPAAPRQALRPSRLSGRVASYSLLNDGPPSTRVGRSHISLRCECSGP